MLGVRFLDVDFMRINLPAAPDCLAYTLFLNSQLRLPSRSRPINRGRQSAGIFSHRDAGTFGFWKAHLKGALSPTFYECTPGRGTFWFQIFIQASSPEIWSETISGGEEVLAGKWGGLFLGYLLGKNFRRRKRGFVRRVISEVKISGIDWCLGRNCLIHFRDRIDPISTWLRP